MDHGLFQTLPPPVRFNTWNEDIVEHARRVLREYGAGTVITHRDEVEIATDTGTNYVVPGTYTITYDEGSVTFDNESADIDGATWSMPTYYYDEDGYAIHHGDQSPPRRRQPQRIQKLETEFSDDVVWVSKNHG
jgi:hypothetical protein